MARNIYHYQLTNKIDNNYNIKKDRRSEIDRYVKSHIRSLTNLQDYYHI